MKRIGANYIGNGRCEFTVWAPLLKGVSLRLLHSEELVPMDRDASGCWKVAVEGVSPGTRYFFRLEGNRERPDPASNFQPEGVHGPSEVVDHGAFSWEDKDWRGIPLSEMIMYELHVGTFTREGTFDAVIERIPYLKELGVNAIEIMPVAQFPGDRNWGYDGAYPFAVQNSYGGPEGLKMLVNECHKAGIAVILDVVYNHLGPEGNYIWDFALYFTEKYKTPWGWAVNYDDAYSDDVRNYFIENAIYWFDNYHIDALRLDAVHGIFDMSARPFLQELTERVKEFSDRSGRRFYLIAESDLNDSRLIKSRETGGFEIDATWCDDFHHCVHTLLTGERDGYYMDFGSIGQLAKSMREGFVYSGQYSEYRKRDHGNSSRDVPADRFVVFSQNHDQVGNRMMGERLSNLVSFEGLKLAAGVVLLSPYIPLLFMGEEYGKDNPFLYFVSHTDPVLIEAVRKGRKEEFRHFDWKGEPPDPQSKETFLRSKPDWEKIESGRHKIMLDFYRRLIKLRRETPALSRLDKGSLDVCGLESDKVLFLRRWNGESHIFCVFNFTEREVNIKASLPEGNWKRVFDSSETSWNGPGSLLPSELRGDETIRVRGHSFAVFGRRTVAGAHE